jgi:hypothetical protein
MGIIGRILDYPIKRAAELLPQPWHAARPAPSLTPVAWFDPVSLPNLASSAVMSEVKNRKISQAARDGLC